MSNFLFTFLVPSLPGGWTWPTVESFLGRVDVFHSMNAVVLPQRAGRRVVTIHDLTCLRFPRFHPWSRRMLFRLGIARSVRLADGIIVPSSATEHDLGTRFPQARSKIHVVPEAPADHFAPGNAGNTIAALGRYGLTYRDYFLFVGNVEPRKNLGSLIEAYTLMRTTTCLAPRLVIAGGPGWRNDPIYRAAAASRFAADIAILGYVAEADLPTLMNGALAFVYPSLYEGFGLPVLEAMACGTPVITSNHSSLPEVAGDAALLVDPGDRGALVEAMTLIADDAALRDELQARGLRQARRFSWDETARLTRLVYEGQRQTAPSAGSASERL